MKYMHLPLIVPGSDIGPPAVLHQLVQERALEPVFDGHYLTGLLPESYRLRAHIAGHFMPNDTIVALDSAVWVYAGGNIPDRLSIVLKPGTKSPPYTSPLRIIRTDLEDGDIVTIDGVPVTSRERTVVDLARWFKTSDAVSAIQKLAQHGADLHAAKAMIGHKRRNCVIAHEVVNKAMAANRS